MNPKSPDYLPQAEEPENYYIDAWLEQAYEERTHLEDDMFDSYEPEGDDDDSYDDNYDDD